jgi:hypothetical protein
MSKKTKKINEFLDVPFEIETEIENVVLTDSEINRRREEAAIKMKDTFSNINKSKNGFEMTKDYFENYVIKRMYEYPNTTKNDIDLLYLKFFKECYYKV